MAFFVRPSDSKSVVVTLHYSYKLRKKAFRPLFFLSLALFMDSSSIQYNITVQQYNILYYMVT